MIKVITGIYRCGKIYLVFDLFRKRLIESGIAPRQIIEVALDDEDNERLRDPKELSSYVRSKIKNDSTPYHVLLEEIRYAISDEELKGAGPPRLYGVLNGLLRKRNVDIYVTGSNPKLLSTDVMTEFGGRGDEIHIRPLANVDVFFTRCANVSAPGAPMRMRRSHRRAPTASGHSPKTSCAPVPRYAAARLRGSAFPSPRLLSLVVGGKVLEPARPARDLHRRASAADAVRDGARGDLAPERHRPRRLYADGYRQAGLALM